MIKENNNCMKPYRSWHQSIELEFNSYVPETIDSSNNINSDKKCCINAPVVKNQSLYFLWKVINFKLG